MELTCRLCLLCFQVGIPSRQMTSETWDAVIPEKYTFTAEKTMTEDKNTDHDHDRYGNLLKGSTLTDECLPNKSSSEEELKLSPYLPRKQDDSKPERREDAESDDKTMAHVGLSEIECGGINSARRQRSLETRSTVNGSGSLIATSLPAKADRLQPFVELYTSEQHLIRLSPTCDRQSNFGVDVADSTLRREMMKVNKNDPFPFQDRPSSSTSPKSPFPGGEVVVDDSPRHPDYAATRVDETNTIKEIQRDTKTSNEIKCSYERPIESRYSGAGRRVGLKGGKKDQSSTAWDRGDTLELDAASRHNGAKLKIKEQLDTDFLLNTTRVGNGISSQREGESDFSGIRPFFLARHTDDSSMSMTSETWNVENTEDKRADILSRYQRFGCYPDRCYHSQFACPPPLLLPQGTECYTGAQVLPPPILGTNPAMAKSLAHMNGNEKQPQTYDLDNEPAYSRWDPCSGIFPSNSKVSIRTLPPPPLPSPPCGESEYHVLLENEPSNGGLQSTAPQAISTASNPLSVAQAPSAKSQVVATTRPENTGLGLLNNTSNQKEIGHPGISDNPKSSIQNVIRLQAEATSTSEGSKRKQREPERGDGETATATVFTNDESSTMHPVLQNSNSHISDDESLAALERRVAEACSLVERVLKEREEKEKARKDREQRQREERARRELQGQESRAREVGETMQRNGNGEGTSTGSEEAPSQRAALPESPQWLCEHYQRLCRVKFPCCGRFYSCHRCHNNSDECQNKNCNAKEAFYIECSVCRHQQEVCKSLSILLLFSKTALQKFSCCLFHANYPIRRSSNV